MQIYGVFFPYHKSDFISMSDSNYDTLPDYPLEFMRYRVYGTKNEQLESFANTRCPASVLFECEEAQLEEKLQELRKNYSSREWLKVNVEPYL